MKIKNVEIYSEEDNNSIVRMPERNYLGAVIQGDVLFLMHGEAMDILEESKHNPGSYAYYKAYSIAKSLEQRLVHYIDVCNEHEKKLSFDIELSVEDYDEPL